MLPRNYIVFHYCGKLKLLKVHWRLFPKMQNKFPRRQSLTAVFSSSLFLTQAYLLFFLWWCCLSRHWSSVLMPEEVRYWMALAATSQLLSCSGSYQEPPVSVRLDLLFFFSFFFFFSPSSSTLARCVIALRAEWKSKLMSWWLHGCDIYIAVNICYNTG